MPEEPEKFQQTETVLNPAGYTDHVRRLSVGVILLNRYKLVRLLGQGGMGVVWLAHDHELNEDIALKFLPEMLERDKTAVEELKVEVRRSRRLTHPNIVRIHDYLQGEGWAGISMEFVDGDTLSNLRVQKPSHVFEPDDLKPLVKELCSALDYAHTNGKMVHHDLKPSNCMLTSGGELKLCDFGIARSLSDSVTRLTTRDRTSGTLIYMSPQQLMGDDPSPLDDVYSLGAMIFELLSSKAPFYSGNIAAQVMEKPPPSIAQRREALGIQAKPIPKVWEETVAICLAKEPAQRPQSAGEVAEYLGLVPQGTPKPSTVVFQEKTPVTETGREGGGGWKMRDGKPGGKISEESPITPKEAEKKVLAARQRTPMLKPLFLAAGGFTLLLLFLGWWHFGFAHPKKLDPKNVFGRGGVMVRTTPEGAMVMLGGEDAQTSPATFKGLKVGSYKLKVTCDNYEPVEQTIEVKPDEFVDPGNISLVRSKGGLRIESDPTGADYDAKGPDGIARQGKTPETLKDLPAGNYDVVVRQGGWETKQQVEVKRNETALFSQEFALGSVSFTSDPSGAQLFCNGKSIGKTPVTADLLAGNQEITAQFGDWAELKQPVMVKKKEMVKSFFKFEMGQLNVKSEPEGAGVKINGKEMGKTPTLLSLPAGEYKVELTARDYNSYSTTIHVELKQEKTVEARLSNPRMEGWSKFKGNYKGKLLGGPFPKRIDLALQISGDPEDPVVSYTSTIYGDLLPSISHCSNDSRKRSRFVLSVKPTGEGLEVIEQNDHFGLGTQVNHHYIFKPQGNGSLSATYQFDSVKFPGYMVAGVLTRVGENEISFSSDRGSESGLFEKK